MLGTDYIKVRFEGPRKRWTIFHNQTEWKSYDTKKEAVSEGRKLAKSYRPSQLIVNNKSGEEVTEVTSYD